VSFLLEAESRTPARSIFLRRSFCKLSEERGNAAAIIAEAVDRRDGKRYVNERPLHAQNDAIRFA
jgi:hypothetical protein